MKAIITGGNRGIGLEISKRLLGRGFEVHVLSRSGIDSPPDGVISWTADISDYEQTVQIVDKIGHVDVLINNAGIMNAMRSLARTFGPRGVVTSSVAPGPVETEMMKTIPQDRKDRLKAATINQRFCSSEEVAETVCWLATDAPATINGEVIDLNNGANCR